MTSLTTTKQTTDPTQEDLVGKLLDLIFKESYRTHAGLASDEGVQSWRKGADNWRNKDIETLDHAKKFRKVSDVSPSVVMDAWYLLRHSYDKVIQDVSAGKMAAPEGVTIEEVRTLRDNDYKADYSANGLWHYIVNHQREVYDKLADIFTKIADHLTAKEAGMKSRYGIEGSQYLAWQVERKEADTATAEGLKKHKEWLATEEAARKHRAAGLPERK